ncbi:MerR family transcriptional regulator [Paenibacillus sp. MMS18-CY102]|uniref:MerR family transcriptional regulator n=1 Tax=Paenibacillus sp. MMS18-CY102 TaxID=2682849 RepID=UPI0013657BA0|nr:MerR family transcriptional regulator [Paenibacillus sp. MMS18-CY102]MWC31231.1 MerR family transcriptional regulator [Paenibacillus sp. MMS18-CY102]
MAGYLRGEIARLANVNTETLRYYENLGLIVPPQRSDSGYRLYAEDVLHRLTFIQNAKSCGFTLKEIKKALAASVNASISIEDFITVIDKKMDAIHSEISRKEQTLEVLKGLKQNLLANDKHPEVQSTLNILHMES